MLEGDPIQLAKMILALGDLLQRPLLGRAELEVGSGFHTRRSIRACARGQCGAVAQPMLLEIPIWIRALGLEQASKQERGADDKAYPRLGCPVRWLHPCRDADRSDAALTPLLVPGERLSIPR